MDWRGLMQHPGNRHEIMNGKGPWIMVAIPTYKIKRMCPVDIRINQSLFLDLDFEISLFIKCFQVLWPADISFTKWGMLHQLPKFISISFWSSNRFKGFNDKQSIF